MKKISKIAIIFGAVINFSCAFSENLTTYVAGYSGYAASNYPFEGSHPLMGSQIWHNTATLHNADMVAKSKISNVLAYAFFQAWNDELLKDFNVPDPEHKIGALHFSDIWADLPSRVQGDEYSNPSYGWKTLCQNLTSTICSTIQQNSAGQLGFKDYNDPSDEGDLGQGNNFGAFLKLPTAKNGFKIISIGGANIIMDEKDPHKNAISQKTYDAIFMYRSNFLNSLSALMLEANKIGRLDGVDFDFEPRLNMTTGLQDPAYMDDAKTISNPQVIIDYNKLYQLIIATRNKLPTAYISVTLTMNKDYLTVINRSIQGGWFKRVAPYVNAINIMTYDMHGPWSVVDDPATLPHAMMKQPPVQHQYAINYGIEDVGNQVKSYGVDPAKLQVGIGAYARGFANVSPGPDTNLPGFDQPYQGPSIFPNQQDGLLPYKDMKDLVGYTNYEVKDTSSGAVIASYLYSSSAKQFLGYFSQRLVDSICQYTKAQGFGGAIIWTMDNDAPYTEGQASDSLIGEYHKQCA